MFGNNNRSEIRCMQQPLAITASQIESQRCLDNYFSSYLLKSALLCEPVNEHAQKVLVHGCIFCVYSYVAST